MIDVERKRRIVFDAGDNTALFVEQNSPGDYLATMYPIKESDLTLKIWASLAWSVVTSSLFVLAIGLMVYGFWSALSVSFPGYSWLIAFVLAGAFGGGFLLSKNMYKRAKADIDEKMFLFVREILRDMKSKNPEPVEEYSIKASYLYNGMDGDFITWYKQEKNKTSMKRSW